MKNIDYIIKKVSKENNLNEKVVDHLYRFYWKESILKSLRSTKHTAIYIPFVGTAHMGYMKVRKEILEVIYSIRTIKKTDKYTDEKKAEVLEYYINYLKDLLERRRELIGDYTKVLNKIKKKNG